MNLQRWIEEVRRYTASNVILFLIGNKSDMEDLREVEFSEAEALCQYIPEIRLCIETSAKDNRNVTEAFMSLATELKVRARDLFLGRTDLTSNSISEAPRQLKCRR